MFTVGISLESQTQPHVTTHASLKSAREYAAAIKKDGGRVLWVQNANTGREHRV